MGPRGEADIIRRIDVSAPFGEYFIDRLSTPGEYIACGGQQLPILFRVGKIAMFTITVFVQFMNAHIEAQSTHMIKSCY